MPTCHYCGSQMKVIRHSRGGKGGPGAKYKCPNTPHPKCPNCKRTLSTPYKKCYYCGWTKQ